MRRGLSRAEFVTKKNNDFSVTNGGPPWSPLSGQRPAGDERTVRAESRAAVGAVDPQLTVAPVQEPPGIVRRLQRERAGQRSRARAEGRVAAEQRGALVGTRPQPPRRVPQI